MSKSSKGTKKSSDGTSANRLMSLAWRYMGEDKKLFILATAMLVLEAATAVVVPLVIAYVINYLTARLAQLDGKPLAPPLSPLAAVGLPTLINQDVDTLIIITVGLILLTMVNSLCDSLAEVYLARAGRRLGYNLRVSLYSHLQKLSLAFHDQRHTGDVLTRVTGDVAALEDFVISDLSDLVGSLLLIAFILVAIVTNAWQVALVAAAIVPIMALVSNYFTRRIKSASKKRRTSEGELASAAQEMLASIRVIQTYGLGSYEQSLFAAQSQKAMDAALEAANLQAQFSWVVSVLGAVSTAAVIWMATWLIFRTPLSIAGVGLLTAYIKYIQDMFKPTKRIIQEWNTYSKLYASVERVGDLLDLKPAVDDSPNAIPAPHLKGQIEFRNVTFSYQPVSENKEGSALKPRIALKNLDFDIQPGEVVAIVGHTGAGKSTIVQLLPRLYDPTSGQILFDGHDIREFTLESLRGQIAMVLQESILFSGSVVENIAYGRPDATGPEIVQAARQANAHEFIEKLPEGYYTILGERGSNLSGGQRQRLAIARAFIRNPSILILDEPTTGLDAESTELVLRALRTLMKGKTSIIISHDLALIRDADKIIVINSGEIEQIGNHESLLREGGLYANLYLTQTGQMSTPQAAKAAVAAALGAGNGQVSANQTPRRVWIDLPDFELHRNPSILNTLPALEIAYDGEAMKEQFQEMISTTDHGRYRVEKCDAGKGNILPDYNCLLQYNLEVSDNATGQVYKPVINARLFQTAADSTEYMEKYLAPLGKQMRRRSEIPPFFPPIFQIENLKLAASVFPVDGQLPTLIACTDQEQMTKVFSATLPDVLSGGLAIEKVHIEPVTFGRFSRTVLRYTIEGHPPEQDMALSQIIYGKVDAGGTGGLSVPVIAALREMLRDPSSPYYFRVPRSLGYLPDLKLLLLEALPGERHIKRLLVDRIKGKEPGQAGGITLEAALEGCALMAASLHQSGIPLGRRRIFKDEVNTAQAEIKAMEMYLPDLAKHFRDWLTLADEVDDDVPPLPLVLSHGDFRYTQLSSDGEHTGLVDFDTICQAEPALDLGQFIAYQRLTILKEQNPEQPFSTEATEALCASFLDAYGLATHDWMKDEAALRARVLAYEVVTLIRYGVHSWQKLKGSRLELTLNLLEERTQCLKQPISG